MHKDNQLLLITAAKIGKWVDTTDHLFGIQRGLLHVLVSAREEHAVWHDIGLVQADLLLAPFAGKVADVGQVLPLLVRDVAEPTLEIGEPVLDPRVVLEILLSLVGLALLALALAALLHLFLHLLIDSIGFFVVAVIHHAGKETAFFFWVLELLSVIAVGIFAAYTSICAADFSRWTNVGAGREAGLVNVNVFR